MTRVGFGSLAILVAVMLASPAAAQEPKSAALAKQLDRHGPVVASESYLRIQDCFPNPQDALGGVPVADLRILGERLFALQKLPALVLGLLSLALSQASEGAGETPRPRFLGRNWDRTGR